MTDQIEPPPAPAPPAAPPAARPADEIRRDPLVASVVSRHSAAILDAREFVGEITLVVQREQIREVCQSFKDDGFKYLVDISGLDFSAYPNHAGERFALAYHLYSHAKNDRIRLKVFTSDGVAVPSVTSVWKTANWHEREAFDMFGIKFEGHPNLERILMWEGFNGHPLRKDFPLRGIDTGARIYPEVFPAGGGPQPGSTGKDYKDVNVYKEEWEQHGRWPMGQLPGGVSAQGTVSPELATTIAASAQGTVSPELATTIAATAQGTVSPELATTIAASAVPTPEAPFHDPSMPMAERMELAKERDLKTKLFAAMAQTDCTACGWDCEGYAAALASGESKDITLCVPGEAETESMLKKLIVEAGKL